MSNIIGKGQMQQEQSNVAGMTKCNRNGQM